MYPTSGTMKDPKTGKILDLEKLYQGEVVEVTQEQLSKYDMHPQSGTMKNINGEIVSIPQMLLGGGGNTGIVKSTTRPTKYEVDKTIWVKEDTNMSVDTNSFVEQKIEDFNIILLNGASNLRIDEVTDEMGWLPISPGIDYPYLSIKIKADGINGFTRQQILMNYKDKDCIRVYDEYKISSEQGYITPCINLEENKVIHLYIGNEKINLRIADYNDLDSYGNAKGTKILEVINTVGIQEYYDVWFDERMDEIVIEGKDKKVLRLSIANEQGLKFTKFNGISLIIAETKFVEEVSVYFGFNTYHRIGNLNKNLNSKTVTLLGENENFDVVLGSK